MGQKNIIIRICHTDTFVFAETHRNFPLFCPFTIHYFYANQNFMYKMARIFLILQPIF